jgi:2'-5' RNA ligase
LRKSGSRIRAFVCVSPDEKETGDLARFMGELGHFPGFRWVERNFLHITLKFLGEITPELVTRLDTNMSRIGGIRPFRISLSHAGVFPEMARPYALWIGVGEGGEELSKLAASVDRAAVASGCEAGKRGFHPHITLARARSGVMREMTEKLVSMLNDAPHLAWICSNFTLMKSDLSSGRAVYTPLRHFSL